MVTIHGNSQMSLPLSLTPCPLPPARFRYLPAPWSLSHAPSHLVMPSSAHHACRPPCPRNCRYAYMHVSVLSRVRIEHMCTRKCAQLAHMNILARPLMHRHVCSNANFHRIDACDLFHPCASARYLRISHHILCGNASPIV